MQKVTEEIYQYLTKRVIENADSAASMNIDVSLYQNDINLQDKIAMQIKDKMKSLIQSIKIRYIVTIGMPNHYQDHMIQRYNSSNTNENQMLYDITYHLRLYCDATAAVFGYRDMLGWLINGFSISFPTGRIIHIDNSEISKYENTHNFDDYIEFLNYAISSKCTYEIVSGKSFINRHTIFTLLLGSIVSLSSKRIRYSVKFMTIILLSIVFAAILFALNFVYCIIFNKS